MEIVQKLANEFSGPIVFDYVWWVLHEAQKRRVKRLYFCARDGYTLQKVAMQFCKKNRLKIECRYLYCSRMSLRMPSYFFIGDEAYDLLLNWGYCVTLKALLCRGKLSEDERKEVYQECGLISFDENQILNRKEFDACTSLIRNSKVFRRCICKYSRDAYETTINYFEQEGLYDSDIVAIVDSGWTGSMQRSLRQLMEFSGYNGRILGFYFGMYELPKSIADGEYLTWYFNAGGKVWDKIWFNNNLFECLLSAPHGMTVGYKDTEDGYEPILLPFLNKSEQLLVEEQSVAILNFCKNQLQLMNVDIETFPSEILYKDISKRIKQYMFWPTQEQAAYYGQFFFSDDVAESHRTSLADQKQIKTLKLYFFPQRVMRKIRKDYFSDGINGELFWPCGTAAFLSRPKQLWYCYNIFIWELIKQSINHWKKRFPKGASTVDYFGLVKKYKIISFDIFDTLLYRAVSKPSDVFFLMEPQVERLFGMKDFAKKRIEAEIKARQHMHGGEITVENIYADMDLNSKIADQLIELEQRTELSVLRRDNAMAELLNYCVAEGKRVLIISDMYQSKQLIVTALTQLGIKNYASLYVSSAEKATKYSGRLYKHIINKEKLRGVSNWLHIGDDEYADEIVPNVLGISTARYDNGRKSFCQLHGFKRCLLYLKALLNGVIGNNFELNNESTQDS